MKEPPLRTRLLGHPLVGLPITGASMLTVYGWTQDSQAALFALVMLAATGAVAKASTTMTEYKAWKRAWEDMGEGAAPRRRASFWLGVALAGAGIWFAANADPADVQSGVMIVAACLAALAALVLLGKLSRHLPRLGRANRGSALVAIVARSVMAVPSMTDAYGALPEHCRQLLGIRR